MTTEQLPETDAWDDPHWPYWAIVTLAITVVGSVVVFVVGLIALVTL